MSEYLKRTNTVAAKKRDGRFTHPKYEFPYEDYPNSRRAVSRSLYPDHWNDDDEYPCVGGTYHTAFGLDSLRLADTAISHYRSVQEYPQWSTRICIYPVPRELHTISRGLCGPEADYPLIECTVGGLCEWLFDTVLPLWEVRVFTIGCLTTGIDPIQTILRMRGRTFDRLSGYLFGIVKRQGFFIPKKPTEKNQPVELREISYLKVGPVPDDYDSPFSHGRAGLLSTLQQIGIGTSFTLYDLWFEDFSRSVDVRRQKELMARNNRPSVVEEDEEAEETTQGFAND